MGTRLKVLIIEDELITAMDLRETLEEAGHIVTAIATNSMQAIAAVQRTPPDLALIDIALDGFDMEGISVAKELLKIHRMPFIYLTANAEPQTFLNAKQTFPAAYILKPFRTQELLFHLEMAWHNFSFAASLATGADCLYLPIDKGYEKVICDDVLYLKADGSYVKVFLIGKEAPFHISTNLSHLAQYFTKPNFYRLSRSLLINIHHLERLEQNHIFLAGGKVVIPVPLSGRKELMNKLMVVKTK